MFNKVISMAAAHLDRIWAIGVALYEPAIIYSAAGSAAVFSALSGGSGDFIAGLDPAWMQLFGFALGTFGDLHARGRVYAARPAAQRQSRLREWKSRLGLAAIGLGFGVVLAGGINNALDVWSPVLAHGFVPMVNFFCVLVAVPIIDGVRGLSRILSGKPTQEAFARLVIGWAQRRSGGGNNTDGGTRT